MNFKAVLKAGAAAAAIACAFQISAAEFVVPVHYSVELVDGETSEFDFNKDTRAINLSAGRHQIVLLFEDTFGTSANRRLVQASNPIVVEITNIPADGSYTFDYPEPRGLEGAEKRYIWQLSGGQRQRVGIARALAANPQLLLLDEPFGALDAFTRDQMQTLLLKLWQETGKQVLLITHDIEEAVFMATELVLLSPGPGRVLERLPLNFARRFVAGESSRSIKSDPQFIAMREYVLSRVFEQREAFS